MSRPIVFSLLIAGVCAPALAYAQDLSSLVASNEAVTPRPSYRQSMQDFPPPGGRYGGGALEYVLTGGRPEPIAPQYEGVAAPQIGYIAPVPPYIHPVPKYPAYVHGHRVHIRSGYEQQGSYRQPAYRQGATYAPAAYGPPPVAPLFGLFAPASEPAYAPAPQPSYAPAPTQALLPTGGLPNYDPRSGDFVGGSPAPQPVSYGTPGGSYDPVAADPGLVTRPMNPMFYRQEVAYAGGERPGTVVIDTPDKFLYLVRPGGRALRYGIGVGRPGFSWSGVKTISRKAQWPGWTPPSEMLARRPDLPRHMDGGEANPLGARALYLGILALPHPRHQRALHDRDQCLVRLHPDDERRRGRPLRPRRHRNQGDRSLTMVTPA